MPQTRKECVKNINLSLEKVLETFTEIVELLRSQNSTKTSEMKALVFSKKRMCELLQHIEVIFQNFIHLKLIYKNFHLKYESNVPKSGFDSLFTKFNKEFESKQ